jgi:hypothetical protein
MWRIGLNEKMPPDYLRQQITQQIADNGILMIRYPEYSKPDNNNSTSINLLAKADAKKGDTANGGTTACIIVLFFSVLATFAYFASSGSQFDQLLH